MEASDLSLFLQIKESEEDFLMVVMAVTEEILSLKLIDQCTICRISELKLFKATTDTAEVAMEWWEKMEEKLFSESQMEHSYTKWFYLKTNKRDVW